MGLVAEAPTGDSRLLDPDAGVPPTFNVFGRAHEGFPETGTAPGTFERNFRIRFGQCADSASVVSVSQGNRPETFQRIYKACAQKIVTEANGRFPGLLHIGGPVPRCIDAGPRRTKFEWYEATGGTCKARDFVSVDGKSAPADADSVPAHGARICSGKGPAWTRPQIFAATDGTCRMHGKSYGVSLHSEGRGVDFFLWRGSGCAEAYGVHEGGGRSDGGVVPRQCRRPEHRARHLDRGNRLRSNRLGGRILLRMCEAPSLRPCSCRLPVIIELAYSDTRTAPAWA